MENVKTSVVQLIGNTPMLELVNYEKAKKAKARIITKLECMNPAGSLKDRIALSMIEDAEKKGQLYHGATLIEPTSGNTGIGIAAVAAAKGYKAILVMPETMSIERRKILQAYGAKVVLTDGAKGMNGAIAKAKELNQQIEGSVILSQFTNQANPGVHRLYTGPEIWKDMDGKVDFFVAGVGTGGTITGVGEYLKKKNPSIQIIAVEPAYSPTLTGGKPGAHKIQGIGTTFIPETLNVNIYDKVISVTDEDAMSTGREIALLEGILVGISSGAAVWASLQIAKQQENRGKNIVTLLADTGDRYLSTALFTAVEA